MRKVLFTILLWLITTNPLYAIDLDKADCKKQEDICSLMKTQSHFAILDKCPGAGPMLLECKKTSSAKLESLPEPEFVANEDGTITDTVNKLVWMKTGVNKKFSLKMADEHAINSEEAGVSGWRVPTLKELSSLLQNQKAQNARGKTSWIHPLFDDTGEYYYWTTTSCEDISEITDRYQKKTCQQGAAAGWLINFKAGAIIWHFVDSKKFYAWLVRDLE
ncbi:MAG: DUF1566 domain-containing protein [Candidatus Nitronauta litoralis]|uniref:DUF1566 domain-containing protein n=1 Tax=Candidatus Nitronauta litoralis TaxID=2705533 RepID=A0A7T0BZ43_9BACT|nr:MAG: DUF1566 domain-containing protein [Candidatus Nitronauta litoralis]